MIRTRFSSSFFQSSLYILKTNIVNLGFEAAEPVFSFLRTRVTSAVLHTLALSLPSTSNMAALVQSYTQESLTMLQPRPSSAGGILPTNSQAQSHQFQPTHAQRSSFHGMNGNYAVSNYRGHTAIAPIAPYAFTSTPGLTTPKSYASSAPFLQSDQRTSSAPILPASRNYGNRSRYPAAASVSTTSSSSSELLPTFRSGSKDDLALGTNRPFPSDARLEPALTSGQSLATPNATSMKSAPDRYRRPNKRVDTSQGQSPSLTPSTPAVASMPLIDLSGKAPQLPEDSYQSLQLPDFSNPDALFASAPTTVDDQQPATEQAKRYRRRSIHTIGNTEQLAVAPGFSHYGSRQVSSADGRIGQHPLRNSPVVGFRPAASDERHESNDSIASAYKNASRSSVSRPEWALVPNLSVKRESTSCRSAANI